MQFGVLTAEIPAAYMPARWHGKHNPLERWRERLARGLTAFFLAFALLAFGGFTAMLAAAEGEQGIPVHRILSVAARKNLTEKRKTH